MAKKQVSKLNTLVRYSIGTSANSVTADIKEDLYFLEKSAGAARKSGVSINKDAVEWGNKPLDFKVYEITVTVKEVK